jgi:hypothetical protein
MAACSMKAGHSARHVAVDIVFVRSSVDANPSCVVVQQPAASKAWSERSPEQGMILPAPCFCGTSMEGDEQCCLFRCITDEQRQGFRPPVC